MAKDESKFSPGSGWSSPARNAFAITPSDSADLAFLTRGIYVGGAGNLSVILADDTDPVSFVGVLAGTLLALRAKRVRATGTTATSLVGVY